MVKSTKNNAWCLPVAFCAFCFVCSLTLTGCGHTYPKDKIRESIINLCKKEYRIDVDARVTGDTVAVYLPAENLFDAVFNLDPGASKKINDVILGISRVTISTDAKFNFYVVIAQDPKMPEIEIVYIRYVDDVKKFLLGAVSRAEYTKRAVITIKTPPQAERERILKELFDRLKIENGEKLLQQYLESEEGVAAINEISYWNKKFYIKKITVPEFLAAQIEERIKMDFRSNRDLNKWYELKGAEGKFTDADSAAASRFTLKVDIADRVAPLYLESGMELGAQKKRALVFERLFGIAYETAAAYKFWDFRDVEFIVASEDKVITKEQLRLFGQGRMKTGELI